MSHGMASPLMSFLFTIAVLAAAQANPDLGVSQERYADIHEGVMPLEDAPHGAVLHSSLKRLMRSEEDSVAGMMRKEPPHLDATTKANRRARKGQISAVEVPFHGSLHHVRKPQADDRQELAESQPRSGKRKHHRGSHKKRKAAKASRRKIEDEEMPVLKDISRHDVKDMISEDSLTEAGKVGGELKLSVSDIDAVINEKENSEHALAEAIAPADVPWQAVTVDISLADGSLLATAGTSFMTAWRAMRAGAATEGEISANFTMECPAEKAPDIVTELKGANITRMAERIASTLSVAGINTSVSISSIDATVQAAPAPMGEDTDNDTSTSDGDTTTPATTTSDTTTTPEPLVTEDDSEPDVLSGKLELKVSNASTFISNGEAQEDVSGIIADFANVTEDAVFDEFHQRPGGKIEITFRITIPKHEDISQIAGYISGTNRPQMQERLEAALENNGLSNSVEIVTFESAFDEPSPPAQGVNPTPEQEANAAGGGAAVGTPGGAESGIGSAGNSENTGINMNGDDDENNEEAAATPAPTINGERIGSEEDGGPYYGEKPNATAPKKPKMNSSMWTLVSAATTTTDPMNTMTMTTTFVPQDEIDGELDLQVSDTEAFLLSVDLQDAVRKSLAFAAGLNDTNDMFCKFKVVGNQTLLELSGSSQKTASQPRELLALDGADDQAGANDDHSSHSAAEATVDEYADHGAQRNGMRIGGNERTAIPGGVQVEFKITIQSESTNSTLEYLRHLNMTDLIEAITEDVTDAGLQMPTTEISTLYVDSVETNIADPPKPLRLPFGDNVTSWTPEQAAAGGPPTTPPPWMMATPAPELVRSNASSNVSAGPSSPAITVMNNTMKVVHHPPSPPPAVHFFNGTSPSKINRNAGTNATGSAGTVTGGAGTGAATGGTATGGAGTGAATASTSGPLVPAGAETTSGPLVPAGAETTTPAAGGETTTAAGGETTTAAGGETTTAAGGTATTAAGGESTTAAGGETTTAAGGETTTAAGGETTTAAGGTATTAAGGETTTAAGGETTTAAGGETTTAAAGETTTPSGGETTTTAGAATTTPMGEKTTTTVAGGKQLNATGGVETTTTVAIGGTNNATVKEAGARRGVSFGLFCNRPIVETLLLGFFGLSMAAMAQ